MRTVKLTKREPFKVITSENSYYSWRCMHDAAPDDATEALERHLWTVRKVLNGEASLNDLGGSYDALRATESTAALIRQAEERKDG